MALRSRIETWLTLYLDLLPMGDRPAIGAGYAMAAATAVAAIGFGIVLGVLSGIGAAALFVGVGEYPNPLVGGGVAVMAVISWLTAAGTSLGIVVPGGFVGGVVVWRFVPASLRLGGFVGGLLSTLVGYAVCWALLLPFGVFVTLAVDPAVTTAAGSALELGLLLGFISVYTSWATLPAGLLTGYLYERSLN